MCISASSCLAILNLFSMSWLRIIDLNTGLLAVSSWSSSNYYFIVPLLIEVVRTGCIQYYIEGRDREQLWWTRRGHRET